jgi:hypothetical protein
VAFLEPKRGGADGQRHREPVDAMNFPDIPKEKNRRLGIFLFLFFLAFTALAVLFVILRKFGYA